MRRVKFRLRIANCVEEDSYCRGGIVHIRCGCSRALSRPVSQGLAVSCKYFKQSAAFSGCIRTRIFNIYHVYARDIRAERPFKAAKLAVPIPRRFFALFLRHRVDRIRQHLHTPSPDRTLSTQYFTISDYHDCGRFNRPFIPHTFSPLPLEQLEFVHSNSKRKNFRPSIFHFLVMCPTENAPTQLPKSISTTSLQSKTFQSIRVR